MRNKILEIGKKIIIVLLINKIIFTRAHNVQKTINYVFQNNEKVQLVKKNLELAILEKYKLITELLPDINSETTTNWYKIYKLYLHEPIINNFDRITVRQHSMSFTIEQEIFSGGSTILKFIVLNNDINIIYQEYNKLLNDIIFKCLQYYQNIISIRKLLKIQKENILIGRKIFHKIINIENSNNNDYSIILIKTNMNSVQNNFKILIKQHEEINEIFKYYTGNELPRVIQRINKSFFNDIPSNRQKYKIKYYRNNIELNILKNNLKNNKSINNINICYIFPKVTIFSNQNFNNKRINNFIQEKKRLLYSNWGIKIFFPIFSKGGAQYINIKENRIKNVQSKYTIKEVTKIIKSKINSFWEIYMDKKNLYIKSIKIENIYYKIYLKSKLEFFIGEKSLISTLNKKKDYNDSCILKIKKENSYFLSVAQLYNFTGELVNKI